MTTHTKGTSNPIQHRIILLMFPVLVFLICCNEEEWHNHQFVYIGYEIHAYEEILEGNCPISPTDPTACYTVDLNQGQINNACFEVDVNKRTQAAIGMSQDFPSHLGGIELRAASEFPFTWDELRIYWITEEGQAKVQFRDTVFTLQVAEMFQLKDTRLISEEDEGNTICIKEVGTMYRIANWGFIDKENLVQTENR